MNYSEIILRGYFDENNREFLEKYFFREFKKAEKDQFFEADEFFNGCIKVIEGWEKHLEDQVFRRKHQLYEMLSGARNGTMHYKDLQGKTVNQINQETIDYCEEELKNVRPDGIGGLTFNVNLFALTNGRIAYNISYGELLQIKLSILKAYKKSHQKTFADPSKEVNPENKAIKYNAKHYVLSFIMECNAIGKSLPIGQKKVLENVGNKKMGAGKGNRFYKVFNEIVKKDLIVENNLIEIGGENWREIVKNLSTEPEKIEIFLQSKHL
ncbi:hypothetical protein AAGF08_08770 [Algoriphagus sp. SE2]|uniref:hypothetical protein n=1 Tax=Algoriphagus sp. SE2 TaxID=3141536 RepID=UPI0031CD1877